MDSLKNILGAVFLLVGLGLLALREWFFLAEILAYFLAPPLLLVGLALLLVKRRRRERRSLAQWFRGRASRVDEEARDRLVEGLASTFERAYALQQANEERVALDVARLQAHEPEFDPERFLAAMEKRFVEIRTAVAARDLDAVGPLVSDGMLARFAAESAIDDCRGRRQVLVAIWVLNKKLYALEQDGELDTIRVTFRYGTRHGYVPAGLPDEQVAAHARLSSAARLDTERWSFVRRCNSTRKAALGEGRCPGCAEPLERASGAACGACGAILNSGAYDWVLAGITGNDQLGRNG